MSRPVAIATNRSASARISTHAGDGREFFGRIKHCRRAATGYDKLLTDYLAFVQLSSNAYGCALMSPGPGPSTPGERPKGSRGIWLACSSCRRILFA